MYFFGYGSLINAEILGGTLKRKIEYNEMTPAILKGFSRSWTAGVDVDVNENGTTKKVKGIFFDLTESEKYCNGILMKISKQELDYLIKRELGYELISVKVQTENSEIEALTFKVSNENKTFDGFILSNYINIINAGLLNYKDSFREDYWKQVLKHNLKEISGNYNWLNSLD